MSLFAKLKIAFLFATNAKYVFCLVLKIAHRNKSCWTANARVLICYLVYHNKLLHNMYTFRLGSHVLSQFFFKLSCSIVFCSWFRNIEKSVFSSFVVICSFHCLPFIGVADPHYFDVDEDLTFHFIVDPDQDPAPHQSYRNLRPVV